jgi:hypothetical protein
MEPTTTLIAAQFISARVPSGELVTMHRGNTREIAASDAAWLLGNYADRFEPVAAADAATEPQAAQPDQLVRTESPAPEPEAEHESAALKPAAKKKK